MNIFDNLLSRIGYTKAKQQYPAHVLAAAGAASWDMPVSESYYEQVKLYTRLSWIYGAVSRTAETAALQALNVKRMIGERTKDIPNHEFELLLMKPNPLQSRFEFFTATYSYLSLTGNSYWWLNRTKEGMRPSELWIIPSYKLTPVPDERMFIKGYSYDPGTGASPMLLPTWQIIHFKSFNPLHEYVGMSGLQPLNTISRTDLNAQSWANRYYGENNARLPGILAFKDMIGDPQWEKLRLDTQQAAKMRSFLMLRGVGDSVDWIQAATSQKDQQYIEQREFTKEEIYSIYAPGYASMIDVNATEANSKAGKQTFLEFAIWPRLVAVSQKITKDILPVYGRNIVCEFEDPRQTDRMIEMEEQRIYALTHTIDEIREEYYEDGKIGDDRGLLLPAQVGAAPIALEVATGEEPEPVPQQLQQEQPAQEEVQPVEPEQAEEAEQEEEPEPREMMKADLDRWQRKVLNAIKKGKSAAVKFESQNIPLSLGGAIEGALLSATTPGEVKAIFTNVWIGYP